jgi:hypothetical protein
MLTATSAFAGKKFGVTATFTAAVIHAGATTHVPLLHNKQCYLCKAEKMLIYDF